MNQENVINLRRRNLIKFAVFGALAFVAGKLFEPLKNTFQGDRVLSEKSFNDFTLTETGKQLKIADKSGSELLVFEKDSF